MRRGLGRGSGIWCEWGLLWARGAFNSADSAKCWNRSVQSSSICALAPVGRELHGLICGLDLSGAGRHSHPPPEIESLGDSYLCLYALSSRS